MLSNIDTPTVSRATTGDDGTYSFTALPAGHYRLEVTSPGFKPREEGSLELTVGATLKSDATLELASETTTTEVSADTVQINLTDTQIGETITAEKMTSVPLNGRSFTDLLAVQPGVVPASSAQANAVVMSGCTNTPPSGDLNPGNMSVSGQRETANGFNVNGSVVEEDFNNGTAVIPNLDSIDDFRVLTSNFDAEYGNFSGGQVLVTTKSGSDHFHGSAFEFLRNTALDARNYFATRTRGVRSPSIWRNLRRSHPQAEGYFFRDYQGTLMTQGQETGKIVVPSLADRGGSLLDLSSQLTGSVSSDYWANQLSQKLGYAVSAGERYYSAGCSDNTQCVFPNAQIPTSIWSAPAKSLLNYIPQPNVGSNLFSDSAENETLTDHKAAARFDMNTRFGNLTAYYFTDQYFMDNPYPTGQGGANVPGFNAISDGRAQLISLGLTRAWGANTVNEARFSYLRNANKIGQPVGGVGRRSLRRASSKVQARWASCRSTRALKESRTLHSTTSPSAST